MAGYKHTKFHFCISAVNSIKKAFPLRLKEKEKENENLGIFLLKKTKTTIVNIIKHLRKQKKMENSPLVILWDNEYC